MPPDEPSQSLSRSSNSNSLLRFESLCRPPRRPPQLLEHELCEDVLGEDEALVMRGPRIKVGIDTTNEVWRRSCWDVRCTGSGTLPSFLSCPRAANDAWTSVRVLSSSLWQGLKTPD